jgi:Na+-driven multidrug efflux pump
MVAMVGLTATRAAGRAYFQAYAMVASAVLSMVLAPPLIFGMFGLPRLGLAGAALATVGAAVPVLVGAQWRLRRDGMLVFDLPSRDQFLASAARILHVALPAAATNIIIPAATMIVTAILAAFGTGAIAAFGIATRIESVAMIGFFALSAVMNPFCGQNAGAHRTARIRRAITLSTLFCLGLGAVLAPLLFVAAPWLVGIFTTDREVARIAVAYLRIVPVSYGAAGLITVVNAAFNGLGRPAAAVAVSLARMVAVNIPVAWLGGRLFGVEGVFLGIAVANITVGLGAALWLRRIIQESPSEAPASGADQAPVRS